MTLPRRVLPVAFVAVIGVVGYLTDDSASAQGRGRGPRGQGQAAFVPEGAAASGPLIAVDRERPSRPAPIKFNKHSRKGTQVARGRKVARERNGVVTEGCDLSYTVETSIARGRRRLAIDYQPDCTATLVEIDDTDVIEDPADDVANHATKPPDLWGRLWQSLMPVVHAQEPFRYRTAYFDIWTCGINCLTDGLTMQQGYMSYKYVPYQQIQMTRAIGWFCTAGVQFDAGQWRSNCLAPHHQPGTPMNQQGNRWWGYNPWITERVWGGPGSQGSPYIYASEQTSFFHQASNNEPRTYDHTLYVQRYVTRNGTNHCQSTFTGTIVSGPLRLYATCEIY